MKPRTFPLAAALAAILIALPGTVSAQDAAKQAAPVVAVVDPLSIANVIDQPELRVVGTTKAAKALAPQFDRIKEQFQSEINKKRDELQAEGKKLASQRAILSPDAYSQRETELRKQFADLQNLYLVRRDQLLRSAGQAVGKIRKAMMESILEVAKERSVNLVLPREAVLAVASSLDITADVVKRVDKKLPTMKLELVKPAATPPKPGEEPKPAQPLPRGLKLPSGGAK